MQQDHQPSAGPIVREEAAGTYWWCACGLSKTQPFCDGSHQGTELQPMEVQLDQAGEVAWCCCKKTGTKPFCDGSHQQA
jgi:CDGSH-type Zn-finger protein